MSDPRRITREGLVATQAGHSETAPHLRGRSSNRRLATAIVPAAAMTAGLFIVMNGLIQVDEVEIDTSEQRVIGVITPQLTDDPVLNEWERPKPLETLAPPPPPIRETMTSEAINMPPVTIAGAVPDLPQATQIVDIMTGPVAIADRRATPVRPPVLSYPDKAITRGIEGDCKVYFNVSVRGEPFDVRADCTDSVFEQEARRAVLRTQFLPKVKDGRSVELSDVMYPLSFRLEK